MKFKAIVKTVGKFVAKNSDTILTCVNIGGTVATAVLASKATLKAKEIVDETGAETFKEKFKATWKVYIPATATCAATIATAIANKKISANKAAALTAMYTASENIRKEYTEKVKEVIGEKKEREIHDEVVANRVADTTPKNMPAYDVNDINGDILCYDVFSDRYFMSKKSKLESMEFDVNRIIYNDMTVNLNDVYHMYPTPNEKGLPSVGSGYDLGWNVDTMFHFKFSSKVLEDGRVALVVDFEDYPSADYDVSKF